MKRILLAVLVGAVLSCGLADVGNSLDIQQANSVVEAERQDILPDPTAPPKKCANVTVSTQDCNSVIVTRLPFLFNFVNLNQMCDCENGQLECGRGVGANVLQRLQIPALRLVYNTNCKCRCPAPIPIPEFIQSSTATAPL